MMMVVVMVDFYSNFLFFFSLTIRLGFCELRNLQDLDVRSNSYVGSIPQCFGNMNSLRTLYLHYNQFTGTIPSSIFQILTVRSLMLGSNFLKGPFPQSTQRNNSMLHELGISDYYFWRASF